MVRRYYDGNRGAVCAGTGTGPALGGDREAGMAANLFGEVEGRLEAGVDGNLIAGDELVGLVGHADDGLEFLEHFGSHAFAEGGGGMRVNAVLAIIGNADSDVEEFLGERIESAGSHDGFEIFPGALEESRVVSDGFPEIVDVVGFAGSQDVVVDGFDGRAGVLVFDEAESGHG
jgi:hypothetical protein